MNRFFAILAVFPISLTFARPATYVEEHQLREVVYVEAPTDTDGDGQLDRIYVSIERPVVERKLSTLLHISPYALGGNSDAQNHGVDYELLPQDEAIGPIFDAKKKYDRTGLMKKADISLPSPALEAVQYARLEAHSVGTGRSSGCPTVGDMAEALGAKAIIDWLNGRARAFYVDGREAYAQWANGRVGMTGISYDGTLPIMVAATGVEGLKAIVPIAAISSWYDYYRAHGLVVNPGGYIGEDADVLGYFIIRRGSCIPQMRHITQMMGRESGDLTKFWQERDFLVHAKNFKAATFIIHGQNDWNVKQKHAIQLWEALAGIVPRRMFLHRGGHSSTYSHNVPAKIQAWFDHFVEGVENDITQGAQVEVEMSDGRLMQQQEWPFEESPKKRLYLAPQEALADIASSELMRVKFTDMGRNQRLETLAANPRQNNPHRLLFLTAASTQERVLSGMTQVSLSLTVLNRKAANLTVALVEYDSNERARIITRGWADPQNHGDLSQGELLEPGRFYQVNFVLEPKQYRLARGSRLGVLIAATDYEYTLRPQSGTEIEIQLGASFVDLWLSGE